MWGVARFLCFCAYEVCAHFGPSRMQHYTAKHTHCCRLQLQRHGPFSASIVLCFAVVISFFFLLRRLIPPCHRVPWAEVLRRPRSILDCPSAPLSHASVDILKALE